MRGHLFVAHIDDLDPFIQATIVYIDNMPATERKDDINTLVL